MANKNLKSIKFPGLTDTYVVPQVDDTLTQTGRPADAKKTGDEIDALKEDLSTLNTEGTVPTSEQMLSDNYTEDSVPYHFRKTASDNADREELEIVGGSVAWNQIADNSRAPSSRNGMTITGAEDSFTIDGTASASTDAAGWFGMSGNEANYLARSGHKLLVSFNILSGTVTASDTNSNPVYFTLGDGTGSIYNGTPKIIATTITSSTRSDLHINNGTVLSNAKFRLQCFDLTAMFGSTIADHIYSLEQATAGAGVALFKSLFPKDYYAYDAGSIQSVSGLSEHKTVGFNVWDEEWEVGGLSTSTGANSSETDRIRSKNYIHVFPNTSYYFKDPTSNNNLRIVIYDSDKNFVRATNWLGNTAVGTGSNGHYVRFFTGGAYGKVYKNDICINISDSAKNGTYEPYQKHTYALDDSLTLRGIPTLVDGKIKFDGDIYSPSGKVTRRYGIVDLGTLTYTKGNYDAKAVFYASLNDAHGKTSTVLDNGLCTKYQSSTARQAVNIDDASFSIIDISGGANLYIRDDAFLTDDAATFKTAMSGQCLVYELATPTTETADPYVSPQICHYDGTEEFVSTGIVPVGHNTKYPDNMRAKLDGLPWNFASLIAPTESGFTATRNYTTGQLLIVNNVLYKATANIANGGTITPNTNVTATTLAEVIAALS